MIGLVICLDADELVPRSAELVLQSFESTLLHGTLLAGLTWIVTRWHYFRARPALSFALWALALLKFFLPSGPAVVPFGPSALLVQAIGAVGTVTKWGMTHSLPGPLTTLGMLAFSAYILTVLLLCRRWMIGQWLLRQRVEQLGPAGAEIQQLVRECAEILGVPVPAVRMTTEPWTPMVVGCLNPIVVLPAWIPESTDCQRAVLLHELGHIKRHDPWFHQFQLIAESVFFFWPVVHFVTAKLREAREMACDALVLTHGEISANDYGQSLLQIARQARALQEPTILGVAIGSRKLLERRIDYLLSSRPREHWTWSLLTATTVWGLLVLSGAQPSPDAERIGLLDQMTCQGEALLAQLVETASANPRNPFVRRIARNHQV